MRPPEWHAAKLRARVRFCSLQAITCFLAVAYCGLRRHAAARCLDDYFVNDDGSYEYDPAAEPAYRASLFGAFTKTVAKPKIHPLVFVDAVHVAKDHFEQLYVHAVHAGYHAFVAHLDGAALSGGRKTHASPHTGTPCIQTAGGWGARVVLDPGFFRG